MKIGNAFCLLLFFFFPGHLDAQTAPNLYKNTDRAAMDHWVDSVFDRMTVNEKIGQLFMIMTDPRLSSQKRILPHIEEQKIGGILFSRGDLKEYARSINLYQKKSRIPLFIAFDGEWGLSMRIDDTPRFPKNMMLGAIDDSEWLVRYGEEMARECRELGVHINFAPVLDVNSNPDNPVIGTRSFGENSQSVTAKGLAYVSGLEKMRVLSVAKHFPGHGDTAEDSHKTLPEIRQDRERLDSVELYPFVQYIRNGYAGIMTGHLFVPALDSLSKRATSLSSVIVTDLLTNELGFEGLKFTDALAMKGAATGNHSAGVESLLAGNDILLNPPKPAVEFASVKRAVETGLIPMATIEEKCRKILRYKYICGLNRYKKPIALRGLSGRINSTHSEWLIQKLNEEAITLLKNEGNGLPLHSSGKKTAVVSFGDELSGAFRKTMDACGSFDFFHWAGTEEEYPAELFEKLEDYEVVIEAIHSDKIYDYPEMQSLAARKEMHLCFFMAPYQLRKYSTIASAQSVILAYENTEYAQKAAAKVILGRIPAKGKLPVTIAGFFDYGTGFRTLPELD
ncbi:MAG: glycoside hydrolase family 3 protein [Dysgonamonadaceae bacterium]|jgi:beta-glucosidase-like glycosyl hydrolase|nr:glycoside hydrolase family 3 protein [Dysgonamonadaceae bacterium]